MYVGSELTRDQQVLQQKKLRDIAKTERNKWPSHDIGPERTKAKLTTIEDD